MRTRIAADPTRRSWPADLATWPASARAATHAVFWSGRLLAAAILVALGYTLWLLVAGRGPESWVDGALTGLLAVTTAWAVALLLLNRHLAGRGLLPGPEHGS